MSENINVLEKMESVKKKFNDLQKMVTDLNNQKISLESEVKTVNTDIDEQLAELFKLTGKENFEESVQYFHGLRDELVESVSDIEKEIDMFLHSSEVNEGEDVEKDDVFFK